MMKLWTSFFLVFSAVAVAWPFLNPGESGQEMSNSGEHPETDRSPWEEAELALDLASGRMTAEDHNPMAGGTEAPCR